MKRLLTVLFLLCSAALFAQNWSPILVNEKMNYQHSDSSYISHTIWVDSAFAIEADSIFYLNRIVKDVPDNPEIVLRNQPQFLMEFMVKQIYGIYSFHYPYDYFISTGLPVGASWTFDLTNNIDAEITAYIVEEIFGVMDSVEVISLSDGSEILLSKNFGILKFPDFENGGYYELVGIQNTEYGESVPDFWDIFDFEVGDVFQYTGSVGGGGSMYIDYYTQKYTITSKTVDQYQYNYNYEGIRKGLIWDIGNPWNSYGYSELISGEFIYTDSLSAKTNYFNGELMWIDESYNPISFDDHTYARTRYYSDSIGEKTKQYGFIYNSDLFEVGEVLAIPDTDSDTLLRFTDWSSSGTEGVIGMSIKERLGITCYIAYYFEDWNEYYLEGYIKDGDTVGTITPDSLLLTKISDPKTITKNWIVYPNPTKDWLYIKQSNPNYTYNIELRNLYGQLVKEEINIQSPHYAMDVAELKAGVYFYMIKEHDEIVQQGKLIIK